MALVTLAELKAYLGESGSTRDTELTDLADAVSNAVLSYLDREVIESAAVADDVLSPDKGDTALVTTEWPVTAITSVYDDPLLAYGADTLIAAADYTVRGDGLGVRLKNGVVFGGGADAVKISYTAGYAASHPTLKTIKRAALMWADFYLGKRQKWARANVAIPDLGVSEGLLDEMPKHVRSMLNTHRRWGC